MDNWAHMLPQASRQVHSACSACVFAHLLPLLPRPPVPRMFDLSISKIPLEQSCEDTHDSFHGLMTWSSHTTFRLFRSFRLRVCVKDHHKAFLLLNMQPKLHLFHAVSERTRIWCPPWTAGIWFWSRPGGRAKTTPPSAKSTTTMSLSGWRTWARMSSDFSKRSESEPGGRGHATVTFSNAQSHAAYLLKSRLTPCQQIYVKICLRTWCSHLWARP